MNTKPFVEYLDKEMTIMGILSAFSVATPAGILVVVTGKDSSVGKELWNNSQLFLIAGSFFCIFASAFFYKERSDLAWFYGQLSLATVRHPHDNQTGRSLSEWLIEADAWSTWWPYCCGWTSLITGFAEFIFAVIFYAVPNHWLWFSQHLHAIKIFLFWLCPTIAIFACLLQSYVRIKFKLADDAWGEFWASLRKKQS